MCVFKKGSTITENVFHLLWKEDGFDQVDLESTLQLFVDRALLTRKQKKHYVLHDLLADFLHSRDSNSGELHKKLINRYKESANGKWTEILDDKYFYQYFIYHLTQLREIENHSKFTKR